jgi:hypothetical protein
LALPEYFIETEIIDDSGDSDVCPVDSKVAYTLNPGAEYSLAEHMVSIRNRDSWATFANTIADEIGKNWDGIRKSLGAD